MNQRDEYRISDKGMIGLQSLCSAVGKIKSSEKTSGEVQVTPAPSNTISNGVEKRPATAPTPAPATKKLPVRKGRLYGVSACSNFQLKERQKETVPMEAGPWRATG
jgi:hypothetical protein